MTLAEPRELIRSDLFRYLGDTSFPAFVSCLLGVEGFRYSYLLRKCRFFRDAGERMLFRSCSLLLRRYRYKYGFDIPAACEIGPGLYIGHFGRIIVNPDATIGSNVNINHGVTIGQTNRGGRMGVPRIGSRVWLGAYSIIVGNIRVGDNTLIGPGAFVNFDVPENAVVMGNPGRIVSSAGTQGYLNHLWGDASSSRQEPVTGPEGTSATNDDL